MALVSGLPNRARETWLIAAPMFHGWGWLNTMLSMLFSSTIVVTCRFDPERLLSLVERERCQVLVAVPAMLRRIMDLPSGLRRRYDTSSLRAVTVSGSALPPALAGAFMTGRLFIAGRADDMIITGGENVYPAEVESALEQHPAVREAAIVGYPDETYGQILVAHVVLSDENTPGPRAFGMVPRAPGPISGTQALCHPRRTAP